MLVLNLRKASIYQPWNACTKDAMDSVVSKHCAGWCSLSITCTATRSEKQAEALLFHNSAFVEFVCSISICYTFDIGGVIVCAKCCADAFLLRTQFMGICMGT